MKFIGKFVSLFDAIFKKDVTLDGVETGTIASGGNLGLDSNNKIVKNTVSSGTTDLTSDVTGVLPVANGGTGQNSLGSVNISSLNNDSGFTANTGDITQFKFTADDGSGSATTVTAGDVEITFSGGEGIDTSVGSTSTVTISAEDASESNKGIVELATTAEADTGTDTARAVTPAGLKSHVDARFTNQIFSFTFSDLNYVSNTWTTPSQHGPTFYSWNNRHGSGQAQASSHAPSAVQLTPTASTISVDYLDQGAGIVIPVASKFIGFYGNIRLNGTTPNTARPVFAIYRAPEPANDNDVDITATVIAFDSYDTATGNRRNRFMKLENFPGTPVDLAQGDILFPAIGLDEAMSNNNGDILGSFTIVLRTLIP